MTNAWQQNTASMTVIEGERLQSYIKEQQDTYLSRPGYEVYFYSRQDTGTAVNPSQIQSFVDVAPTLRMESTTDMGVVCPITDIRIYNSVDPENPSMAMLTITQPKGIEYFLPTIGDKPGPNEPDFDFMGRIQGGTFKHRIGVMDTVLIKLLNVKDNRNDPTQRETTFRGVVAEIHRKESIQGSVIQLRLVDFSEFLRRMTAVNYGVFSTISISLTGRGLTYNALRYANALLNGQKMLFQMEIPQADIDAANQLLSNVAQFGDQANQNTTTNYTPPKPADNFVDISGFQDAMTVPPFFALEFMDKLKDGNISQNLVNDVQAIQQLASTMFNTVMGAGLQNNSALNTVGLTQLSPEDQETVPAYMVGQVGTSNDTDRKNPNSLSRLSNNVGALAWVGSDIFMDPTKQTFEHQYIWKLISDTAASCFREAFIDFKPKLSKKNATTAYSNADVYEQKHDTSLHDLHPNIAVVKYRLSPALLPYKEDNLNSQFWMYKFGDSEVVSYESVEQEASVFTHVLAYGLGDSNQSLANFLTKFSVESKGLSYAIPLDSRLTKRIGYRFMADSDAKMTVPFLRGFMSYAMLQKAQLSMFRQQVTLPGRPDIQPGSIVRLLDKKTDYYCTGVGHSWSLNEGYKTTLTLNFGHTQGRLSTQFTGAGVDGSGTTVDDMECANRHDVLKNYITTKSIGGVDVECFVEALWNYWSHGSTSDSQLQNYTKEAEEKAIASGQPLDGNGDWIDLVYTPPSTWAAMNDGIILSALQSVGLDKYNVTVNTIKNLIGKESSFNGAASNDSGGGVIAEGWYQFLFTNGTCNLVPGLSVADAHDFNKATQAMAKALLGKFQGPGVKAQPGCSGAVFLRGIQAWNGAFGNDWDSTNPSGEHYVRDLLGSKQAVAIAQGNQTPATQVYQGGTSGAWPYYVYGPCGIRVAQAGGDVQTRPNSSPAYADTKKMLLHFDSGMKASVSYVTDILKQYSDQNTHVTLDSLANNTSDDQHVFDKLIDQNSTLDKAIAAWYSNAVQTYYDPKFDPKHFSNVLTQVRALYNECLNCAKESNYSTIDDYNLNVGKGTLNQRIYQAALQMAGGTLPSITSGNAFTSGESTLNLAGGASGQACCSSLQVVLQAAGVSPAFGDGTANVSALVQAFQAASNRVAAVSISEVQPGDIWVQGAADAALGQKHIGVVMSQNNGDPMIISNSTSQRRFCWYAADSFMKTQYSPNLPSGYYRILS